EGGANACRIGEAFMRYKPKNVAALHLALGGLPDRMRVNADQSTGVSARTVGELRKARTWAENYNDPAGSPSRKCRYGEQGRRQPSHAKTISKRKLLTTTGAGQLSGSMLWAFLLRLSKTCGFRNLFGAACGRHCAVRHEPYVSRYRPGRAPACFLERCGAARSPFSRLRSPFRSSAISECA